ncbi:hypothetical protein C8J57DRAFT_1588872 [Mycena rebaudengoi]|nr:hypothetical protein C8J57DRAFT_1588872 [Mycena rebaudengoi]
MDTIADSENSHSDSVPQPQLLDTSEREAPITTLPPELICEIFFWTLPAKTYMYMNDGVKLKPSYVPLCAQLKGSPWILGHVCQQWRAIALSFPTLWSSITVFAPTTPISVIPIVEAQLHRLPLLKELVLAPSTRPFRITFIAKEKIKDTFLNAPSLSKVVLASSYWTPNSILPWAQLTEYNASFTPLDHFGHLRAAPDLVHCDITVQTHGGYPHKLHDYPQSGQTVTLHALRRLVVSIDKFLHCLVTPALDELYIIGACDAVQSFLDRSSCVLTRLTLYMCDSCNSIIALLQSTPSLTTLQIDFSGGAEEMSSLISALTIDAESGGPCLCPNLTSISWADRKCVLSHAAFVDMVQSRWRVADTAYCRRLHSVEILLGRVRIIKTRTNGRRLEALRDEGLEVSIVDCRQVPTAIAKWREW